MTTTDINAYLGGFGIENDGTTMADSKWVYVKELLSDVNDAKSTSLSYTELVVHLHPAAGSLRLE